MCKAFSCIITKRNKIYWKMGIDSHEDIRQEYMHDQDLKDNIEPPDNTFARIEICPENGDYVNPSTWVYAIDERVKPEWLTDEHEKMAWSAWKQWIKELRSLVDMSGVLQLKNPLLCVQPPRRIEKKHLVLLKEVSRVRSCVGDCVEYCVLYCVRYSIWDSVWDSVGDSVRSSVEHSVGYSIRSCVRDSVWDSIWANIGVHFKGIKKWEYTKNLIYTKYPFMAEVKLWRWGVVPSFDGTIWRLHAGKDAKILWSGTQEDVDNYTLSP